MACLLLVAAAVVVWIAAAGVVSGAGADLYVYPSAGTLIQTAIDGAEAGDTIYVHAGTYVENLDVWKRVTLIGDGADVVTVRADVKGHVFDITVDYVNISGFTATGAIGSSGIYLDSVEHCNITSNTCSNNDYGIVMESSINI